MNSAPEIPRLLDLLPAAWRMHSRVSNNMDQSQVILSTPFLPWADVTKVTLNLKLWLQLAQTQRDLLFIREIAWRQEAKWFKFGIYQIATLAASVGVVAELWQSDPVGVVISGGLASLAVRQVWRNHRGSQIQVTADLEAVQVATRRGYSEAQAAQALLEGIPALAKLEGRYKPEFVELIRCQNLRAMAGLSDVSLPDEAES